MGDDSRGNEGKAGRTTGGQEGRSVPERTAAAFCESDAVLKSFFRVNSGKSSKRALFFKLEHS